MKRFLMVLLAMALAAGGVWASDVSSSVASLQSSADYVNVGEIEGVSLDLRYAGDNNFLGRNLYGSFGQAWLHRIAADKLRTAATLLRKRHPGYQLLIYDALRPRSVQRQLWAVVKGTDKQRYVANPDKGSMHNYGFAIDIGLLDPQGREVDMGTGFDDFRKLAQPRYEQKYLAEGKLSKQQLANRELLRSIMTEAGFIQLPLEWWHFDALPKKEVKKNYRIFE